MPATRAQIAPGAVLRLPSTRHVRVREVVGYTSIAGRQARCCYCTAWGEPSYQDRADAAEVTLRLDWLLQHAMPVTAQPVHPAGCAEA